MKKYLFITIGGVILIVIIFLTWGTYLRRAGQEVLFNVSQGQSTSEIGQSLSDKDLISSPLLFSIYVHLRGDTLQTGIYKITSDMTMPQIVFQIKEGKVQEYLVTVPEGYRVSQIDELLAKKGIITAGDLNKIALADEGYLFPDTYHFELNTTAEKIRSQMIDDYKTKTQGIDVSRQTLIIASIVEREAKFDEDRAKIAGVYLSRLEQNMKLQSNPTVEYAKGTWGSITANEIATINSPYNTYMYAGLPPGPICNPGLKSIEAALNPVKDGSLFFFTDKAGHAIYSKTYDEQKAKLNQQ